MNLALKGKTAVVCGSSAGIGKATSFILAQRGATIILVARNKNKLDKVRSQLSTSYGQEHEIICADFNYPDKLDIIIEDYFRSFDKKIDILINNSGGPPSGEIIEAQENEFRFAFERLLICNQIIVKKIVPIMKSVNKGKIINIISMSIRQVVRGLGVSNTVRGSVAQWARTLALELGEFGITVNNVLPGYTMTERLQELAMNKAKTLNITKNEVLEKWAVNTSLRRIGQPNEIGNVIAFLSSEASDYINGFDFCVDGGWIGK
tara:strand:+ start:5399 stop:6187 length:789 start_codon:yes stop_codon:yes gene_type:complete